MVFKKFVINLDRRPDRMGEFRERFGSWGSDVERVSGVDGVLLEDSELGEFEKGLFSLNSFNRYKWAELGVWLSHVGLWRRLANSEDDAFIIFEDDAFPTVGFEGLVGDVLTQVSPDFTIVFLGGKFGTGYTPSRMESEWKRMGNFYFFDYEKFSPRNRVTERTTHCYILTRYGAKCLLEGLDVSIARGEKVRAVDDWLTSKREKFKFLDVLPHLTHSPHNYKTDIERKMG